MLPSSERDVTVKVQVAAVSKSIERESATDTIPSVDPISNQPSQSVVSAVMLYVTPSDPSSSVASAVIPTSLPSAAFSATEFAAEFTSVVAPTADSLASATSTEYWAVWPVLVPSDIVT